MNVFDLVNSVTHNKTDLSAEPDFEDTYSPYIVNKALSMYPDTVLYANFLNQYPLFPKELQYKYYLYSLRPKKRFAKWPKAVVDEDLRYIRTFFQVSFEKAKEYKQILTDEQIAQIVDHEKLKEEPNV